MPDVLQYPRNYLHPVGSVQVKSVAAAAWPLQEETTLKAVTRSQRSMARLPQLQ
jgi:hypothetical protein